MDLNIYNETLTLLGVVDVFKSLLWNRKYFQSGNFELYAPATPNNIELLQKHFYVFRDDAKEVGYINSISIVDSEDDGTMITATGFFLSGILGNRVILSSDGTLTGLIDKNCITTDADRKIQNLMLGTCESITYTNVVIGKQLSTQLEALARYGGFGYCITLNEATKKLEFSTFRGVDRSIQQSVNPQIVFSQEYDNLLSSSYTNSDVGAVNTVYGVCKLPAGIENCTPPTVYINGGSGLSRFETYVTTDAVTYDIDVAVGTTTVKKTYLDYNKTLANMQADCNKAIIPVAENFEGTVSFGSGYKTSYDLGDIVTVFNDELGIYTTQRICEVMEVYDNVENAITPTFGNPQRTIMDILGDD